MGVTAALQKSFYYTIVKVFRKSAQRQFQYHNTIYYPLKIVFGFTLFTRYAIVMLVNGWWRRPLKMLMAVFFVDFVCVWLWCKHLSQAICFWCPPPLHLQKMNRRPGLLYILLRDCKITYMMTNRVKTVINVVLLLTRQSTLCRFIFNWPITINQLLKSWNADIDNSVKVITSNRPTCQLS